MQIENEQRNNKNKIKMKKTTRCVTKIVAFVINIHPFKRYWNYYNIATDCL
jgi:hypothetical protein